MNVLKIVFSVLFVISILCAGRAVLYKRKNIGYILLALCIAAGDLFSYFLMDVQNYKDATKIFLPYYLLHAWALFIFMLMIVLIDKNKKNIVFLVLSAIVCGYQTYLVISQYRGARVFSFQKRIYFRKAFWVAVDSKNTGLLFSFRSYRIGLYINIALIVLLLILCLIKSHKIFRIRYFAFILLAGVYAFVEVLKVMFFIPVWIPCMAYNLVAIIALYFTGPYAKSRLREWSLDRFADDMSDGLILYDRHDDLIHLNEMVKNTLDESLLEDFKDKQKLIDWIESIRDEGGMDVITYETADRKYYLKVTVRNLGGENREIGTLYILHDTTDSVTQIKLMEKANEELERASRMKSDFLANMSHEIRTPMNAVIGMAEIAMHDRDPEQITDYLLQIQSSSKNLLNIINDILDYSKIESGKMELIEDDYEPIAECADIANVVETRIGDKPLELYFVLETDLPRMLRGDSMRIRQVLINLANNAVKFTKSGMVRIHIACEPAEDDTVNVTFHVYDTGIGIKEEDMEKLFVSFQQVDSKRNRAVEGTGLGLAIAKKLVEAMGGEIGVDSKYGEGSDFWFSVPQKVVDMTNVIAVEKAETKHAFLLNANDHEQFVFGEEMKRRGVGFTPLRYLSEYQPTGKKEYLFFEENLYGDELRIFLDAHPELTGIILVGLASEFAIDKPNLHIMRRPQSSISIMRVLNDRFNELRKSDDDKAFKADFIAPDARILIVDDNHINLTIAGGLMAPLKVQIDTADGGQEAIDKVSANEYDIVFMDHMMPEVDGVDATRAIRGAGEGLHQPVIVALSANVMPEARKLFDEAGMNDFVGKPIDVRKLVTTIKKWLPPEKILDSDGTEDETESQADQIKVNLPGLDIDAAVRALGSATLYNEIAAEYFRSGEDKLRSITEAYATQNWEDYTIKVHALKSSSRQIGAMELGDMAAALEAAGKAGDIDKILADTDKTMKTFRALLDDLAPYYGEPEDDDSDKPAIDRDTMLELFEKLEACCDDLDMDGMEEIAGQLKQYSYEDGLREDIAALEKAIADMETGDCVEIMNKIRNS